MAKPIENQMNRELHFLNRHRKIKFGMFTNKGNKAINRIVKSSSSYTEAYKKMKELTALHPEATDTAVRDSVFMYFKNKNKTLN